MADTVRKLCRQIQKIHDTDPKGYRQISAFVGTIDANDGSRRVHGDRYEYPDTDLLIFEVLKNI